MKNEMRLASGRLAQLIATHPATAGMYVRARGDNLVLGRRDPGPDGGVEETDRVRLTRLSASSFGLSVKRHTGRWERTPFTGSMDDIVDTVANLMQHLVA